MSMYDPEARRVSPTLFRQWQDFVASLDQDDEPLPQQKPLADAPAPKPENARTMHRYSLEEQDAYSDRMRARYGREY